MKKQSWAWFAAAFVVGVAAGVPWRALADGGIGDACDRGHAESVQLIVTGASIDGETVPVPSHLLGGKNGVFGVETTTEHGETASAMLAYFPDEPSVLPVVFLRSGQP